jgi:hypothetical protein
VNALLILLLGGLVALGLWTWLASRGAPRDAGPRRGAGPLGLRSAREIAEDGAALEAQDLDQLLAATNARRRARGLPERTREQLGVEFGARTSRGG